MEHAVARCTKSIFNLEFIMSVIKTKKYPITSTREYTDPFGFIYLYTYTDYGNNLASLDISYIGQKFPTFNPSNIKQLKTINLK